MLGKYGKKFFFLLLLLPVCLTALPDIRSLRPANDRAVRMIYREIENLFPENRNTRKSRVRIVFKRDPGSDFVFADEKGVAVLYVADSPYWCENEKIFQAVTALLICHHAGVPGKLFPLPDFITYGIKCRLRQISNSGRVDQANIYLPMLRAMLANDMTPDWNILDLPDDGIFPLTALKEEFSLVVCRFAGRNKLLSAGAVVRTPAKLLTASLAAECRKSDAFNESIRRHAWNLFCPRPAALSLAELRRISAACAVDPANGSAVSLAGLAPLLENSPHRKAIAKEAAAKFTAMGRYEGRTGRRYAGHVANSILNFESGSDIVRQAAKLEKHLLQKEKIEASLDAMSASAGIWANIFGRYDIQQYHHSENSTFPPPETTPH